MKDMVEDRITDASAVELTSLPLGLNFDPIESGNNSLFVAKIDT
jgi:hypothetical protein